MTDTQLVKEGSKIMSVEPSSSARETVLLMEKSFPLPSKAEEIVILVEEYKWLRWDAFRGNEFSIKRLSEIDNMLKELIKES